jgi:hypothetical protein
MKSNSTGLIERLRPRSAAEQAERDLARQAAHDELVRKEAEIAEAEQRTGYREIEARNASAYDAVWDAEYEVMGAKPATPAGAIALLHFVAELIEEDLPDSVHEHYGQRRRLPSFSTSPKAPCGAFLRGSGPRS